MLSFFLNPSFSSLSVCQVFIRIPGVGRNKLNFICKQAGLLKSSKWSTVTDKQIQKLSVWFEDTFLHKNAVGVDFKKNQRDHLVFLKSLRNYKSFRLSNGLPARGQHTKNNAKTARKLNKMHRLQCSKSTSLLIS
jgi:small subunit ribosomal protein S13